MLAVLPAARRLELANVRERLGRRFHFADEGLTERFFPDCVFGAMPPLGPAFGLPTIVDHSLEVVDEIFFEAGDHETLVRMEAAAFMDLLGNAAHAEIASLNPAWIESRRAREHLQGAIRSLSDAISRPMAAGQVWQRSVRRELFGFRSALAEHIAQSESTDGLLLEIEGEAPHLAAEIDKLRHEHDELQETTDLLLLRIENPANLGSVRRAVLKLLGCYAIHRHRGADLVYEAYGVDIGGG